MLPRITRPFLLLVVILLSACSGVENLTGVELASPAALPTATLPPTATPLAAATAALANTASKDFLGTTISLGYPDGWQVEERGQSLTVYQSDPASPKEVTTSVQIFIALTRSLELEELPEVLAPIAMQRFLLRGEEFGFVAPNSVPGTDEALPFQWGGHDAAIFPWRSEDGALAGVQVTVITEDRRRFVLIGTQTNAAGWPALEPVWQAMLGSFTLDGQALGADDLKNAYDSFMDRG